MNKKIIFYLIFLIAFFSLFYVVKKTYILETLYAHLAINRAGGVKKIDQEAQYVFNDLFPRDNNFFVIRPKQERDLPSLAKLSKTLFLMPKDSFHPRHIGFSLKNIPFRVSVVIIEHQNAEHFRKTNAFIEISETIYLFRYKHIIKVPHLAQEDLTPENISKLNEKLNKK